MHRGFVEGLVEGAEEPMGGHGDGGLEDLHPQDQKPEEKHL